VDGEAVDAGQEVVEPGDGLDAGLGGVLTETDAGSGLRPLVTAGVGQRREGGRPGPDHRRARQGGVLAAVGRGTLLFPFEMAGTSSPHAASV